MTDHYTTRNHVVSASDINSYDDSDTKKHKFFLHCVPYRVPWTTHTSINVTKWGNQQSLPHTHIKRNNNKFTYLYTRFKEILPKPRDLYRSGKGREAGRSVRYDTFGHLLTSTLNKNKPEFFFFRPTYHTHISSSLTYLHKIYCTRKFRVKYIKETFPQSPSYVWGLANAHKPNHKSHLSWHHNKETLRLITLHVAPSEN